MFVKLSLTVAVSIAATIAHLAIASAVTVHVLLNKRNVGAAISWMGIAWLSPFLGGLLYFTMGINRVKRRAMRLRRERSHLFVVEDEAPDPIGGDPLSPLRYAVGRLTGLPMATEVTAKVTGSTMLTVLEPALAT